MTIFWSSHSHNLPHKRGGSTGEESAIEYFQQAINKDPRFQNLARRIGALRSGDRVGGVPTLASRRHCVEYKWMHFRKVSQELKIGEQQAQAVARLLNEGATVPFMLSANSAILLQIF